MRIQIIILLLSTTLSSCFTVIGMRNEKEISVPRIQKLAKRFQVPINDLYRVKAVKYDSLITLKNITGKDKDNIEQPNQIIVFDNKEQNLAYLINCNIGGFPYLKWNRFGGMDSLPIRQCKFYDLPVKLSLAELNSIIEPMNQSASSQIDNDVDYYYYIFWSRILFRNSKKMIKTVNQNLIQAKKNNINIKVFYIFSDTMFYY